VLVSALVLEDIVGYSLKVGNPAKPIKRHFVQPFPHTLKIRAQEVGVAGRTVDSAEVTIVPLDVPTRFYGLSVLYVGVSSM
jgi:hypothetical protein